MIRSQHFLPRFLALFLTAVILCAGFAVPALAAPSLPEPTDIFYVGDFANVLSQDTVNHIVEKNLDLYQKTGAQIVVVTVNSTGGQDIESYAYALFNKWKIGSKEENNGLLLLLDIGGDNYWITQGKGLEKKISSSTLDDLLWNYLEADFAAQDYDSGVYKVFDALYGQVAGLYPSAGLGSYVPAPAPAPGSPTHEDGVSLGTVLLVMVVFVIVILSLLFRASFRPRRGIYYGIPRRPLYRRPPIMPPPPNLYGPPPPPRSPSGGFFGSGGLFGGGGGTTRGGGAGRSSFGGTSKPPSSPTRSSSSRSFGSFRSSGGGGSSRGGGAGRRH